MAARQPSSTSPRLGICSWSLAPTGPEDLVQKLEACVAHARAFYENTQKHNRACSSMPLAGVQLALDPLRRGTWDPAHAVKTLANAGFSILSGMMGMAGEDYTTLESIKATGGVQSDETWEANLAAARDNASLARELNIPLVTFHAGFLPHEPDNAQPFSRLTEHTIMLDRLSQIASIFAAPGVQVAFETGQESALTLLGVLEALHARQENGEPAIGINFDPANMILYGMGDPIESLRQLLPHVVQVHIKNAIPTTEPGTWGREIPINTEAIAGSVDWPAFFAALDRAAIRCDCIIEREAGIARIDDIAAAMILVQSRTYK